MSHPGIKSLRDAGLDVWFNAEDAPSGSINDFPVPVRLENGPAEYELLAIAEKSADGHHHAVRYIDHPHRISSFRWLRLTRIRLLTSELELLEHWHNLEFLDLTSLHVAGVTFYQNRRKFELPGLAGMTELEKLSLAGTGVGDDAIRPLSQCRKLKYLDLRMTDLHGEGLKALSDLRGLEVLRLSYNLIEDESLAALSNITSLKRLELDSTDITDAGLKHLRSLENLEELSISHTRVSEAAAEKLQKEIGLRDLTTFRKYDPQPKLQTGPALRPLIGIGDGSAGQQATRGSLYRGADSARLRTHRARRRRSNRHACEYQAGDRRRPAVCQSTSGAEVRFHFGCRSDTGRNVVSQAAARTGIAHTDRARSQYRIALADSRTDTASKSDAA
jgi:hypothetical protein